MLADGLSRMRTMESTLTEIGEASGRGFEICVLEEGHTTSGWEEWLQDEWYETVTHFKLFGDLSNYRDGNGEPLTSHERYLIRQKSKSYLLLH